MRPVTYTGDTANDAVDTWLDGELRVDPMPKLPSRLA